MMKIKGELYRILKEKKYKKYVACLVFSILICFVFLVFFEEAKEELSDVVLQEAKAYNFGLFKIWDIQSKSTSSITNIFNAIIPSGNIAMLIGLYGMNYAYSFYKQTSLFLESRRCQGYDIVITLVIVEVVLANIYTLIYEIALGFICVFWGTVRDVSFDLPDGFGLWIVCLHCNVTAFILVMAMVILVTKKQQIGVLSCVGLVLAGGSCIKLLKLIFHLPNGIDSIWILNNIMYLPITEIRDADFIKIISSALLTSFFAIGLISLEVYVNNKERYR